MKIKELDNYIKSGVSEFLIKMKHPEKDKLVFNKVDIDNDTMCTLSTNIFIKDDDGVKRLTYEVNINPIFEKV